LKQHTLIFVPHARAKFRKWRFSTSQALLVIAPLALVTVGGIVALGLWLSASFDRQQLEQIEQENAELRTVNSRFESSIKDLETKLQDYQQRIHKLAIVAGVSDLTPTNEPGIGGVDRQPLRVATAAGLQGDGLPGEGLPMGGPEPLLDDLSQLKGQAASIEQSMSVLQQSFDDRRLRLLNMPTIAPVKGIVTSGFGNRRDPFTGRLAFHEGLDIVAPVGKEVHATGDGIVTKAGMETGYGRVVYVSHGFGVTSVFGHLSGFKVEQGQKVRRGQVLGFVGSSGRSTGNHLHYEIRLDGQSTNPLAYILDDVAP
jgi:murein DD-endopeptidase MepM/ murein hydrolase activator NlpD